MYEAEDKEKATCSSGPMTSRAAQKSIANFDTGSDRPVCSNLPAAQESTIVSGGCGNPNYASEWTCERQGLNMGWAVLRRAWVDLICGGRVDFFQMLCVM
jgi:hypothetical protein